jgi:hypothetical protein
MEETAHRVLQTALALAILCMGIAVGGPVRAQDGASVGDVDRMLAAWDAAALAVMGSQGTTPLHTLAVGFAEFIEGDYAAAVTAGRTAQKGDEEVSRRAGWLIDTATAWETMLGQTQRLEEGEGVTLLVPRGQEKWGRRVAPLISEWRGAYAQYFAVDPEPLEVLVVPNQADLARVLGVPVARLESSGTVATTLWRRIVIVSPADFPQGYPWHIALCHEMVHRLVHRLAPGRVPHFFEEGLAALLEEWAVSGQFRAVTPMDRALLQLAIDEEFAPAWETLESPFWDLGDELAVNTAFIQAMVTVRLFWGRGGEDSFEKLLKVLGSGADFDVTLEEISGMTSGALLSRGTARWRGLAARDYMPSFVYSDGRRYLSSKGKKSLEAGRQLVLISDLLQGRGHGTAALAVLGRLAQELQTTPDIAWRTAGLLADEGRLEEAAAHIDASLERHPRDGRVLFAAARIHTTLGDRIRGLKYAREAWLVNPFAMETGRLLDSLADGSEAP